MTRYLLGKWATPLPPPLHRHMAGVDDVPPARWPLRRHKQLFGISAAMNAMEVITRELASLHTQICRALTSASSWDSPMRWP